jgi:3-hydroxyisobutyrate dehydrogenase-like beta-hydroxyacid dehydrogenase
MGANVGHTAGPGTGHAAKMRDNPIVGISTTAVAEAFDRDDRLGRERRQPFDVASVNAGPWRALTACRPVPTFAGRPKR